MIRATKLKLFIALLFCSLFSMANAAPNIIFILVDDMGWSDIGPYGSEISTPNLDMLANDGLRFTQFSNTAKCFPSRATLLSGQYAQSVGMAEKAEAKLTNAVTLAEVLKSKNYRTLMVGKHHGLDNPYDRGFDHYSGLRDGATNHFNPGLQKPDAAMPAQKKYGERVFCFDGNCMTPYTPLEDDYYSTDTYTNYALDMLDRYDGEDKPYFLYVSYQAPHDPLQAWPEDIAKYKDRYKVGYEVIAKARYEKLRKLKLIDDSFPRSIPSYKSWLDLTDNERETEAQKMAVYAAMIDRVDQNIGRIIKKVTDQGELGNTLIMFAADNGSSAEVVKDIGAGDIGAIDRWTSLGSDWANVGNTPFRKFKNQSHQGGIITPFIVHWPNELINKGGSSDFPGHLIDIMATFIDLSGAEYPEEYNDEKITPFAGQSLLPIFKGQELSREKPLFWHWQKGRAMRDSDWKIVSLVDKGSALNGKWELYNMKNDKTETTDLADQYPDIVNRMDTVFLEWFNSH